MSVKCLDVEVVIMWCKKKKKNTCGRWEVHSKLQDKMADFIFKFRQDDYRPYGRPSKRLSSCAKDWIWRFQVLVHHCMKPKGLALRGKFWQHWWLEHLRVPILTRTRNVFGELFRRTYFVSFFSPQVKELSCIKSCPTPRFIRNIIFQAPKLPFFLPW